MLVRPYRANDYKWVADLYKRGELYGGQYDDNRDSAERLAARTKADPKAILVADDRGKIVGTLSLIEDGRVAWLYRYAVSDETALQPLFDRAIEVLKARGHHQVLVYAPAEDMGLNERYTSLGFTKGNSYRCYWRDI